MGPRIKTGILRLIPHSLAKLYILYSPIRVGKYFYLCRSNKKYVTKTIFGFKIKGRINDISQGCVCYFGIWEPDISYYINSRLEGLRNRTFIDIGANIGYYSLLAAQCMPHGQVVAVEAFPSIFRELEENLIINNFKNIRAINCAATDHRHTVQMYYGVPGREGSTSSIKTKFVIKTPLAVEGLPLYEILTDEEILNSRLVKIDVEGAEYEVLNGIYPILQRFPKDIEFVVEITPDLHSIEEVSEIFTRFTKEGFFPYQLENTCDIESFKLHRDVKMPTRIRTLPTRQVNIIFSRIDAEVLDYTNQ